MATEEKFELSAPPAQQQKRRSVLLDPEYVMQLAMELTPEAAEYRRQVARLNREYQDLVERGYEPAETKKWKNMMIWFSKNVEAPYEARWQRIREQYSRSGDGKNNPRSQSK